ncbi:MAG TPA: carboxypeptidase regulatory-like domain-containing protein [Candidatus Angelobacter sp.]|jgi:hypothetical protein|nr:carboxypeptidase regulatory-like domain-containing protein [Candidatus Angelobacter sp.]
MSFRNWMAMVIAAAALAAFPSLVKAQATFSSAIEGTVTDPSGAIVPHATVTIKDLATGQTRTTHTNSSGFYRFDSLPPAQFSMTVSAPGFSTVEQENIVLETTQTRNVNVTLHVGATSTRITVTAAPPPVNTTQARVSSLISPRQVEDLPLVGRNVYDLVVLTPGVTGLPSGGGQAYAQATNDIFNAEFGVNLNASGQRAEANNFLVDGANVNGTPRGGVTNLTPNADSVQEVKVLVNNFEAQYGRNSSSVVNIVTKQGTNQLHGTLGEYWTDNHLAARTVFESSLPSFLRNEFNWSLGGPIKKDNTFFFASMDVLRSGVGDSFATSVPSPQFISYMKSAYPNNISTFDMSSFPAAVTPTGPGILAGPLAMGAADATSSIPCDALPGGPSTPLSTPVGQLPCNFPLTENGIFSQTVFRNGIQWNARIDHEFNNQKDRIYGNFYRTTMQTVEFAAPNVYPAFTGVGPQYTEYFNLDYTHIFSPTVLNEAAFGVTRSWGTDPAVNGYVPLSNVPGIAAYGVGFSDATFIQNNPEWRDVLTMNRGTHTFKTGVRFAIDEGWGSVANFQNVFTRPQFNFNSLYDFALDKPFSETNLGFNPANGQRLGLGFAPEMPDLGVFFQDNWKVRPNISLTYGLRWEVYFNPYNKDDRFTNLRFFGGDNFSERIANAHMEHVSNPLLGTDYKGFEPRIGIAWDPTHKGKMAIRAGFGFFTDRPGGQFYHDCCTYLPLFATATVSQQTAVKPVYALAPLHHSPWNFPYPPLQVGLDPKNGLIGVPSDVIVEDPSLGLAYSENYFFGIEYALNTNWMVQANYVGSAGRDLLQGYDVNRYNGNLIQTNDVLTRLNTSFGQIDYGQSNGFSAYNGFDMAIQGHVGRALSMQAAYTLGKAIDTASSFGTGLNIVDVGNLQLNKGLADFDIRQKLAFSETFALPNIATHFTTSGVVRKLFGGWNVGAITILQSGGPYSVFCSLPFEPVYNGAGQIVGNNGCDFNADGWNYDFPDEPSFGNFKSGNRSAFQFPHKIFSSTDFGRPGLGQDGTLGRNTFIGPGFANTDLSLFKDTKIPWFIGKEGATLEIRAEFYNAFNRVNLQNPDGNISDSLFGSSTSTFPARNINLAAHISF